MCGSATLTTVASSTSISCATSTMPIPIEARRAARSRVGVPPAGVVGAVRVVDAVPVEVVVEIRASGFSGLVVQGGRLEGQVPLDGGRVATQRREGRGAGAGGDAVAGVVGAGNLVALHERGPVCGGEVGPVQA